jgi:uncharacterized protein (TIGR01777 family)
MSETIATMRVLVAGSSGLIGSALVPRLRASGHEVRRLVRRAAHAPDEHSWDPPAGRIDDDALEGVDAVVNLCGAGLGDRRWSHARKQVLLDSRTEPTEVLAAAVAKHGVPTLVNGSAVGYYGDAGDEPVYESHGPGTGFLAELCQRWEGATQAAADARVVLLRTGLVLSPHGGLLGKLKPLFSLMLGGRLGKGTQYMPWIHLDDHVAAVTHLVEHQDLTGPVNLTAPKPVTNAEFTAELSRVLGRPAPWVAPAFALKLVLGDLAEEALLGGQRAIPSALTRAGFAFRFDKLDNALAAATGR